MAAAVDVAAGAVADAALAGGACTTGLNFGSTGALAFAVPAASAAVILAMAAAAAFGATLESAAGVAAF